MSSQAITPELREWILAQAAAGHSPEIVLGAMKASGWEEMVALNALDTTMRQHHAAQAAFADDAASPPARPLPGERISAALPRLPAGDREVAVLMALAHPRVVVFGDLLSADECAELIALASTRLARSETVETRTGASEVNAARTSDGMFFQPAEFPVCARLEARIARLLDWPLENGEGLQILRYR
ncbi:MAG: 2-oxoglutarate-dependent dioxygenase, partial [Caldimonas sp.]